MIYDISQELFRSEVYPGDTIPAKQLLLSMDKEEPDVCQLTEMTIGSHNGSHMDAPRHFYRDGRDIASVALEKCMGACKLVSAKGDITEAMVQEWLFDGTRRLLIQGEIVITLPAAKAMTAKQLQLLGVEGLTVGPFSAPKAVHMELLGAETVILEGLRMSGVPEGRYFLSALPLKMEGLDGSPLRAVLADMETIQAELM